MPSGEHCHAVDPSTIATSWRGTHQTQSCHEHGISLRSLNNHRVSHTTHQVNTACDFHIRTILQRFVSFTIEDVWVSHNSPFGLIWWLSWEGETYFHGLKWLRGMIGEWFNQTTSWDRHHDPAMSITRSPAQISVHSRCLDDEGEEIDIPPSMNQK